VARLRLADQIADAADLYDSNVSRILRSPKGKFIQLPGDGKEKYYAIRANDYHDND